MPQSSLIKRRTLLATGASFLLFPTHGTRAEDMQKRWPSCRKCQVLFYNGYRHNKGMCAAGGTHIRGEMSYQLSYNVSDGPRRQGAWRFCNQCSGLFFDGYPDKGVCPAGGGHRAQGYEFVITHGVRDGGAQFRYCSKCHCMIDAYGAPSVCPAGDVHVAQGYKFFILDERSQRID
jgi:hypothetical protein